MYAPSPVHSGNPSTLGHRVVTRQRVRGLACSSNRFDDLDELVPLVALAPGELHKIPSTGDDRTPLGGLTGDGDSSSPSEFEKTLVSKLPKGAEHGVGVHT